MTAQFPPPYWPPRRPSVLGTLLKAFGIGAVIFLCVGLLAGVMAQHELSGEQVLIVVVVVAWVASIAFVVRAVVNARRRAAARRLQELQYHQWVAGVQQAQQRSAYDAEMMRHHR